MKSRRIVLDGRMWRNSGIGTYLRSLAARLFEERKYEWHLIGDSHLFGGDIPSGVRVIPARSPIYSIGEQIELAWKGSGFDLFHAPHYNAPLAVRSPLVVTVHDLTHFRYPEYFGSRLKVALARLVLGGVLKKARRVIAVSRATAGDLETMFRVPAAKIRIITEGPGLILPREPEKAIEWAKRERLKPGFLLFVGNLKSHKNVLRLLEAFLAARSDGLEAPLVVLGRMDAGHPEEARLRELLARPGIIHRETAREEEISYFYQCALGLVFPSLWEGFGLPILEAYQAGIPVACSRLPSHEEIAGPGGFYFDPLSVSEIRDAITRLAGDRDLRARLIENGRSRLSKFSWARCGRETLALYGEVMGR
jgi:glycosyltransferase involved in cell wall biosynthesis